MPNHTPALVPPILQSRGHRFTTDFRQRLAYTLAWTTLARAYDHLTHHGPVTATGVVEAISETEVTDAVPEHLAELLFQAVIGRDGTDTTARTLAAIIEHYHREYGLLIDVDAGIIDVDDAVDATARTLHHRDGLASCRELAALRAATQVLQLSACPHFFSTSLAIPSTRRQYDWLHDRLLALGAVTEAQCRTALFVLAYLTGQTAHLDLIADTPVLLSSAEEVKAVLRDTLIQAAEPGDGWGHRPRDVLREQWFLASVTLLPGPDQHAVTSRREAILTRARTDFEPLWPSHLNREALTESVLDFARSLTSVERHCDDLFDRPVSNREDLATDLAEDIAHLTERRANVHAVLAHPDLLAIEQAHLAHISASVDLGEPLPELILVGEHSKRAADRSRDTDAELGTCHQGGQRLASALAQHGLHIDVPVGPKSDELGQAVDTIDYHLLLLANGSPIDQNRLRDYSHAIDTLDRVQRAEGLTDAARSGIGGALRAAIQTALLHGEEHRDRVHAWDTRIKEAAETRPSTAPPDCASTESGIGDVPDLEQPVPAPEHTLVCPAGPHHRSERNS
ncbi:hypothetical protein [Nocardia sp. NPDC050710]|uniref:hypothetical protein n=1 Tax=Nocardia sp. NPDC050710 TaxID=3157220 RepID=UPI003408A7FC